jgi:hypothetical protein
MVVHCHSAYAEVDAPDAANWLGEPQAQALREALATGQWVDEGDEVVDGRQLGRLRLTGYDHEETLLFDRATYRPVRRVTGAGADAVVTDYEYLSRTAENLDLLVTPAPDGYARMTQVELDRLGPQRAHASGVSGRPEGADHLVPSLCQLWNEPVAYRAARPCDEDSHRVLLSGHIRGVPRVYLYDPTRRRNVTDG